jgi:D-hydroxyproline dehydrogenase subunit gamma
LSPDKPAQEEKVRTFPRGRLPLGQESGLERGAQLEVLLDGRPARAFAGETVAAVLIAEDGLQARRTASGAARGIYCGMGVCFDCLVVVDGVPNTRACMTLVANGMRVERQVGPGRST